jgi:uncharacterized protein
MRRNIFERSGLAVLMTALLLLAFFMPADARGPDEAKRAGEQAFDQGDFAQAYRLWRPLADGGDPELQLQLGMLYWNGFPADSGDGVDGVAESGSPGDSARQVARARYWFLRAAAAGSAAGHHMAGKSWCCWPGQGSGSPPGDEDWRRAVWHFEQAATMGSAGAQLMLGEIRARGVGPVTRDRALAIRHLRDAAANESAPASLRQRAAALATRLESRDLREQRLRAGAREALDRELERSSPADRRPAAKRTDAAVDVARTDQVPNRTGSTSP